jgi:hypothetical protein
MYLFDSPSKNGARQRLHTLSTDASVSQFPYLTIDCIFTSRFKTGVLI